jgi:hypothetical protein
LTAYQTKMEGILKWIVKLEDQLDRQAQIELTDLKTIKEQFQSHEVELILVAESHKRRCLFSIEGFHG